MAKHKIALIPGDGIGRETVPEGCARRSRRSPLQLPARVHRFRLVMRSPAPDRQDDAGRRHGAAQGVREALLRVPLAGRACPIMFRRGDC